MSYMAELWFIPGCLLHRLPQLPSSFTLQSVYISLKWLKAAFCIWLNYSWLFLPLSWNAFSFFLWGSLCSDSSSHLPQRKRKAYPLLATSLHYLPSLPLQSSLQSPRPSSKLSLFGKFVCHLSRPPWGSWQQQSYNKSSINEITTTKKFKKVNKMTQDNVKKYQ